MKKPLLFLIIPFLVIASLTACGKSPDSLCGNGTLDSNEKCDISITGTSSGVCPTRQTCEHNNQVLKGTACQAECVDEDNEEDDPCGNGIVDTNIGETCDTRSKDPKKLCVTATECKSRSTGNSKWVFKGKHSDCTATCTETKYECSDQPDGFCPEKCLPTNPGDPAQDADCKGFWKECQQDSDCPIIAPKCKALRNPQGPLDSKGVSSPFKVCTKTCIKDEQGTCDGLFNENGEAVQTECDLDLVETIKTNKLRAPDAPRMCSPSCTNDNDCDTSKGLYCRTYTTDPQKNTTISYCTYEPHITLDHLGEPCLSSDPSSCGEGKICIKGDFGSSSPNKYDGICTARCQISDPSGSLCPNGFTCELNSLVPTGELDKNGTPLKGAYACFKECSDTDTCPTNAGFCSSIKDGFSKGSCIQLPKECTSADDCKKGPSDKASYSCIAGKLSKFPLRKLCVKGVGKTTGGVGVGKYANDVSECSGGIHAILLDKGEKSICSIDCSISGTECPAGSGCTSLTKENSYCLPKCDPDAPDAGTKCHNNYDWTGHCLAIPIADPHPQYGLCF